MSEDDAYQGPLHPAPLGTTALKALAHPLRVQILDTLTSRGAMTASGLAERLGESSGSTSYHLRQLAKHGFVEEVADKGTARERWWQRVPGGFTISTLDGRDDEGVRGAIDLLNAEFERARQRKVWDFLHSADAVAADPEMARWRDSAALVTDSFFATAEQLAAVIAAFVEFEKEHIDPLRGQDDLPGARPVQVHFNAFPLADSEENPPAKG